MLSSATTRRRHEVRKPAGRIRAHPGAASGQPKARPSRTRQDDPQRTNASRATQTTHTEKQIDYRANFNTHNLSKKRPHAFDYFNYSKIDGMVLNDQKSTQMCGKTVKIGIIWRIFLQKV
jgi:hypothetical protein